MDDFWTFALRLALPVLAVETTWASMTEPRKRQKAAWVGVMGWLR